MTGKDVDPSTLGGSASSSSSVSSEGSRKSRKVSRTFTKQRRVSVEMHPDALMVELLNDAEFMSRVSSVNLEDDDFDFEDSLLSLFEEMSK